MSKSSSVAEVRAVTRVKFFRQRFTTTIGENGEPKTSTVDKPIEDVINAFIVTQGNRISVQSCTPSFSQTCVMENGSVVYTLMACMVYAEAEEVSGGLDDMIPVG